MGSPLDFANTEGFRNKLINRNLPAYKKSPNRPDPPLTYVYIQSNSPVIDSPDELIDDPTFSNSLYPLNQYGAEGGYKIVGDVGRLNNTRSNQGEYGFQDANIFEQSEVESRRWRAINIYGNGSEFITDSAEFFDSLDIPNTGVSTSNNQPYPAFNSSTYSPLSILLLSDPIGNNGLLSQDSFIARLGAKTLREEFQKRIAVNLERETIGRANAFNVRSGTDFLRLVSGRVPLIEPNWTITVSQNPLVRSVDFAAKLAGSELPISQISGSYFDPSINPSQPTTVQQIGRNLFGRGNFFNRLLGAGQTGSEIMYNNMGEGQKSRLFNNINYNKYKPNFDRSIFNRLGGELFETTTNNSNYYVGSTNSDPSKVFSPSGELPVDVFGREIQSPVYGPTELAKLYEGDNQSLKIGFNGVSYGNGGGIEGGFTWVSPKYKDNAGKKVGIGGQINSEDSDFVSSSFGSTESTNREFIESSILYETQRLIDSQPSGARRLQHVGNAIDQVSKVFNDGYKEITKGSRVLSYVGKIGEEVGTEYCRIFTKDTPYLQYNDLQKTDGIVNEGRKFSWSVLDKTYNLNIAPNKREGGQDSSNLIGGSTDSGSFAKKYMFSLENLAWRTSNTPGLTVADLPVCERGPNGGRVMWFPPYDLKFSETVSATWKGNDFIGRPEPIYTYSNTSRSGSLTWKIVVDHPSVLNVIVNKVLKDETNKTRVDSIIESFFAGCRKYDLYELAKLYSNVRPEELKVMQQVITNELVTKEQIEYIKQTLQNNSDGNNEPIKYTPIPNDFEGYNGTAFYFEHDFPKKGSNNNFSILYNNYISENNIKIYDKLSKNNSGQTNLFFSGTVISNFNRINELINKIDEQFKKYPKGTITIYLTSSASAPATISYNDSLSKRRIDSANQFFSENDKLKKWINEGRLIITNKSVLGEIARSEPLQQDPITGNFQVSQTFNCSKNNPDVRSGESTVGDNDVYTIGAMACRRTTIESIVSTLEEPITPPQQADTYYYVGNQILESKVVPKIETKFVDRNNITKYIVRQLVNECDYFETIKEETPLVFDSLKEKLKYFQPAFHSITPEGLNSRLTFLQQCMRPGDTIPVVKEIDGSSVLQYNNAINTSFGSPPVLVLRVGDFYHTKIIPNNLSITYEDLDLNPEGIGVQPMIANITLQFNFVGGHGLKTSIDKLQNALTFNYYANTEIYDDRADVTDDSLSILDKEFIGSKTETAPPTINQSDPNPGQTNGNTIGVIMSKDIDEFEIGVINYSDFMVNVKNETELYFQTVINKIKETVFQYNNAVRQVWMSERNYSRGNVLIGGEGSEVYIFGKPKNVENRFEKITKQLEKDIKDDDEGFIKFISEPNRNFSVRAIRQIKNNYINYIKQKNNFYQNGLTTITQDLIKQEQSFISILGRLNLVGYNANPSGDRIGTDGFEEKNGNVVVYSISGTDKVDPSSVGDSNTLEELITDGVKIRTDMLNFKNITESDIIFKYSVDKRNYEGKLIYPITNDGLSDIYLTKIEDVFIPFSDDDKFVDDKIFRRVYMLVSDDIVDDKKYEKFKKDMIGNVINNESIINKGRSNFEEVFDKYWKKKVLPLFLKENGITKEFIDYVEKNNLKNYVIYTPFEKKSREFTFTTQPYSEKNTQIKLIKGLSSSKNIKSDFRTWNDGNGTFDAFTSKIKLN
jgi:hypothetical protein